MDWDSPLWFLAAPPALLFLLWVEQRSAHPMGARRKRMLLLVRGLMVLLTLAALAGPARMQRATGKALGFVLDASQSMGREGLERARSEAIRIRAGLASEVACFGVLAGSEPEVLDLEDLDGARNKVEAWQEKQGMQTDYSAALELAEGLFPPGLGKELMVIGDGFQTQGDAVAQAKRLAARGVRVHAMGVAGLRVNDVRLVSLMPNRSRVQEGASVELTAVLEGTMDAAVQVRLFENGIEVDRRPMAVKASEAVEVRFRRSPDHRDIFAYRAVIETEADDLLPSNNEALAVVDVRGKMRILYVETDRVEGQYLPKAMEKEGIDLEWRQPGGLPAGLEEWAGFDAVILGDVSADQLGEATMVMIRDYVDKLGGGLVMLGGPKSFGVGGYFKTPLEGVLPVRLRAPDEEEKQSAAVALVLDRSGSMAGEKLEMAKSAAIATAEVLGRNDHLGVYAFDSEAKVVAPMTRLTSTTTVAGQIGALAAGGGTNLEPAFQQGREALRRVKAKVKHMILLTDGQTAGTGYEALAASCRAEGMTISTVALGEGAHVGLLQAVAVAGGGQSYTTLTPEGITRIFTQDTLMHTGRMIREEPFESKVAEQHAMLAGLEPWDAPPLLGYVKTVRRASAQVPLVTDTGDPLLAHWRFGLGKATAFTSDAKSRWGALWVSRWSGYTAFWSQVLRETARPPQGGRLDLSVAMVAGEARMTVDLMGNEGAGDKEGTIDVEVFRFGAASGPGSGIQRIEQVPLKQTGPRWYEGRFEPAESGVYLVRVRSGADTASAGVVYQTMPEASFGKVNEAMLREVAEVTGGTWLESGQLPVLQAAAEPRHVELWPVLAGWLLFLALVDLVIRRWEQVAGLAEVAGRWKRR
jgi:Ca-activated chloride channel family protein